MFAVAIGVDLDAGQPDETVRLLKEEVVPMVSSQPGFVRGTWVRSLDLSRGASIMVFESREAAEAAASNAPPVGQQMGLATIREVLVGEVQAEA